MHPRTSALLVGFVALPAVFAACTSNSTADDEVDVSALTADELALSALRIMGAPGVAGVQGDGACGACHSINKLNLTLWQAQFDKVFGENGTLRDPTKSKAVRINSMRRDPLSPSSKFAPGTVGMLAAGAHLGLAANVSKARHPNAYAQGQLLADLFSESPPELYQQFRTDMLMPIEARYPRFTPTQYETVFTWMKQGLPLVDKYISDAGRPQSCTNSFFRLRQHAIDVRTENWSTHNRDAQLASFGCASPSANPLTCFTQQSGTTDKFPRAGATAYGAGWELEGSSVRVLRELGYRTYFWMRTSADGRFVANGGGPAGRAVIADLAPPDGSPTRDIIAQASYDPDFFPDNKGFMFQGTGQSAVTCAQSLLTTPTTTNIAFTEALCKPTGGGIGLYQTVGQKLGDNDISDRFIINSKFASDERHGDGGASGDYPAPAGSGDSIRIHVLKSLGNDVASGYAATQAQDIPSPFKGDAMMSRSGKLVSTRVSGPGAKGIGYSLDRLSWTQDANNNYTFQLQDGGRVCMPGNKANLSFDERFLTTHHYLTREDFADQASFAPYVGKGGTDIYVSDFVTGRIVKAVHMNPGQLAVFPHFRSDGWLYFLVRDSNTGKEYVAASDIALRLTAATPTPTQ